MSAKPMTADEQRQVVETLIAFVNETLPAIRHVAEAAQNGALVEAVDALSAAIMDKSFVSDQRPAHACFERLALALADVAERGVTWATDPDERQGYLDTKRMYLDVAASSCWSASAPLAAQS